ncbi:hypothetical protein [Streptomyces sp. NPDC058092]|uniref:hypothetical protein n=1 Tax=Streptomyces sp. NPDC058092 TaxID=3346336 RepID=UPI0036ECDDB8
MRITAAASPPEEAADGWDLSAPPAHRLIHLHWQVDATAIADGFTHGFPVPELADKQPPTAAEIARSRTLIGFFLRIRPELLLVVPGTPELAGRAWPSPRTWEMAAVVLAACEGAGADEMVRAQLLFGTVGEAAAFELLSWLINLDLPDPATLLADPDAPLPTRTDQLHALLGAVVGHVRTDGATDSWQQAWRVIARVARNAPVVAAGAARGLAQCRPAGASLPTTMLEAPLQGRYTFTSTDTATAASARPSSSPTAKASPPTAQTPSSPARSVASAGSADAANWPWWAAAGALVATAAALLAVGVLRSARSASRSGRQRH